VGLAPSRATGWIVVTLHIYGDLTFRQIAQAQGTPENTVASRYHLGDYVAVETESLVGSTLQPAGMAIYARSGEKRFFARYWKLQHSGIELTGWPAPSLALVQGAQAVPPNILLVYDGTQAWFSRDKGPFRSMPGDSIGEEAKGFSLSGEIWPGRHQIDYKHRPRLRIEVQTLPDAPSSGLKVIESGMGNIVPGIGPDVMEFEWRLDPGRDDLPISRIRRDCLKSGQIQSEVETDYQEYPQLPAGQWYPTRWLVTNKIGLRLPWPLGSGKPRATEHRLQIFPGQQLDAAWFANPNQRSWEPGGQ
jgi:hypothetical protein